MIEIVHAALFVAIGAVVGWLVRDHQLREYVANVNDKLHEARLVIGGLRHGGEPTSDE